MENEITKYENHVPTTPNKNKDKGTPYAFYSYSHYEVYPGDMFFAVWDNKIIFARALTKGQFEPFGYYDLVSDKQALSFEDVEDAVIVKEEQSHYALTKVQQCLTAYSSSITPDLDIGWLEEIKRLRFKDKKMKLEYGFFRRGSIKGNEYRLPDEFTNEPYIILTGAEKQFLEPFFRIDPPMNPLDAEGTAIEVREDKRLYFRKASSLKDLLNLMKQGKPEFIMSASDIKAKISTPYIEIPMKWNRGGYQCKRGTVYDMRYLYDYFTEQFCLPGMGMSAVNLKQQMMPYYQRYRMS